VIQELPVFSNLEPKVIQVVLVGQPEFEDKLDSQSLNHFKQMIRIKRQIRVLTREESMDYIDHRLRLVGRSSSQMFTPKALSMICSYAQGIPRVINKFCDNALLIGFDLSQKKIDIDIIREVIKDNKGPSLQRTILSSITTALGEFRPSAIRLKLCTCYDRDSERNRTIQRDFFRCRRKIRAPKWVKIGYANFVCLFIVDILRV